VSYTFEAFDLGSCWHRHGPVSASSISLLYRAPDQEGEKEARQHAHRQGRDSDESGYEDLAPPVPSVLIDHRRLEEEIQDFAQDTSSLRVALPTTRHRWEVQLVIARRHPALKSDAHLSLATDELEGVEEVEPVVYLVG
jgi:hypothetical protein